jgi:regulator of extracellular matrix RemA (YlzA/DUF370 family)
MIADGVVALERIVAVGRVDSAPIKRLLKVTPLLQVVVLTGGRRKETVLFLDSGHAVITAVPLNEMKRRLAAAWRQKGRQAHDGGDDNGQVELFLG